MKDSGVFYRVRAEAAFALASQGIHTSELTGLFELKRVYKDLFCRKMRDVGDEYFPVRNDFSVLQNYHIQKVLTL